MATVIRGDDNFDTSAPSLGRVARTAGNITTTSTSLVDVTGTSLTLTTGANPVAYGAVHTISHSSSGGDVWLNIDIDGSLQLGTGGMKLAEPIGNYPFNGSFSGQSASLSAGSHTIKEKWKVNSDTGTIWANGSEAFLFYAREVK